jgi:hypothetical protein
VLTENNNTTKDIMKLSMFQNNAKNGLIEKGIDIKHIIVCTISKRFALKKSLALIKWF